MPYFFSFNVPLDLPFLFAPGTRKSKKNFVTG